MKIITPDDMPIVEMAKLALNNKLYHRPDWTLIRCWQDIINDPDVAETSSVLLLQDDDNIIGAVFHNNAFSHNYWGTNIQAFVKENYRERGYGKMLYKAMNKRLIEKGFDGYLYAGRGVNGSLTFWDKMGGLHDEDCEHFLPLESTY